MGYNLDNIVDEIKEGLLIGKGTSRKVYLLKSGLVCKVAFNNKGYDQNQTEYTLSGESKYLNPVIEISSCYTYVICEHCEKVKGINAIKNYVAFNVDNETNLTKKEIERYFTDFLQDMKTNYDLLEGDIKCARSWGLNKKGNYVIIDYGLNSSVWENHYSYNAIRERAKRANLQRCCW